MKSIQRRFESVQERNPNLSSYIILANCLKNQNFKKDAICRWFNKLVDKDDYEHKDKKKLIRHLVKLSNSSEEHVISGQIATLARD